LFPNTVVCIDQDLIRIAQSTPRDNYFMNLVLVAANLRSPNLLTWILLTLIVVIDLY